MSGDWKRGMRVVDVGLYEDEDGAFHIDAKEFIEMSRSPASPIPAEEYLKCGLELARRVAHFMGAELHECE